MPRFDANYPQSMEDSSSPCWDPDTSSTCPTIMYWIWYPWKIGPRNIWSLLSNTSENVIICIQAGETFDLLMPESHLHFFLYLACVWVSLSVTCASVLFSKILSLAKKWRIWKYCNLEDIKQPKFISFFQVSDYGHILLKFPKLCIVRR